MKPASEPTALDDDGPGGLLALGAVSLVVGAVAGLVGAMFRLALAAADQWRNSGLAWAHERGELGLALLVAICAVATGLAAWLVRRFSPHASGSGIPHVEGVLKEALPPAPFGLLPVKFVGGVLAIGSGLALGREGPSVQMGATLGHLIGRVFRLPWSDCRALLAAGAGAGLATAFNAPIAGAVFVLEELVQKFETRITIASLGASATAIAVARIFLGDAPEFQVAALPYASSEARVLFFVLGAVAGIAAVAYNWTLLRAIDVADRFSRWPVELRAAVVGGAVGVLAWFAPGLVGGGEPLAQRTLLGTLAAGSLPLIFALRFGLGAVSYAARTPGGLFSPMLLLGALLGMAFGVVARIALPNLDTPAEAFAVVGMAAFFTGVVRAPVTAIVLIIEMTASYTLFLSMLGACFLAMLVPTLLRNKPIYDALREHPALRQQRSEANEDSV